MLCVHILPYDIFSVARRRTPAPLGRRRDVNLGSTCVINWECGSQRSRHLTFISTTTSTSYVKIFRNYLNSLHILGSVTDRGSFVLSMRQWSKLGNP